LSAGINFTLGGKIPSLGKDHPSAGGKLQGTRKGERK